MRKPICESIKLQVLQVIPTSSPSPTYSEAFEQLIGHTKLWSSYFGHYNNSQKQKTQSILWKKKSGTSSKDHLQLHITVTKKHLLLQHLKRISRFRALHQQHLHLQVAVMCAMKSPWSSMQCVGLLDEKAWVRIPGRIFFTDFLSADYWQKL